MSVIEGTTPGALLKKDRLRQRNRIMKATGAHACLEELWCRSQAGHPAALLLVQMHLRTALLCLALGAALCPPVPLGPVRAPAAADASCVWCPAGFLDEGDKPVALAGPDSTPVMHSPAVPLEGVTTPEFRAPVPSGLLSMNLGSSTLGQPKGTGGLSGSFAALEGGRGV